MIKVKNLVATGLKESWDTEKGILSVQFPVREMREQAIEAGLEPNENGEVFVALNYAHSASGLRFTFRSSLALGEEVSEEKINKEKALLAEIVRLQALLGKK